MQYEAARAIALIAAPIISFTAEDIWKHLPRRNGDPVSVHLALFPAGKLGEPDAAWTTLLGWREQVTKALEPFRAEKRKSVDARVHLTADAAAAATLRAHAGELADLFIVSAVVIGDGAGTVTVAEHPGPRCERCWKHFDKLAADPNDVCERCAAALRARKS